MGKLGARLVVDARQDGAVMTDEAEARCIVRRPPELTKGDLHETIYALRGIFRAMCWAGNDQVNDVEDFDRDNTVHELAIAERLLTESITERF
jgi:hypothetical protein